MNIKKTESPKPPPKVEAPKKTESPKPAIEKKSASIKQEASQAKDVAKQAAAAAQTSASEAKKKAPDSQPLVRSAVRHAGEATRQAGIAEQRSQLAAQDADAAVDAANAGQFDRATSLQQRADVSRHAATEAARLSTLEAEGAQNDLQHLERLQGQPQTLPRPIAFGGPQSSMLRHQLNHEVGLGDPPGGPQPGDPPQPDGPPMAPVPGMELATNLRPGQGVEFSANVRGSDGETVAVNVQASVAETLGPGLQETVTLEVRGNVGFGATTGDIGLTASSEVSGGVVAGTQGSYQVSIPGTSYEAIRQGDAPFPNPFDPQTIPVGGSVVMQSEEFRNTSMGGVFNQIAIDTNHNVSEGTSIGVERLDENTVRVFAGPTEGVRNNMTVGIDIGPVNIGVGAERSFRETTTRAVDIDISTAEGQAAYEEFMRTGVVPGSDVPGVSNSATIETINVTHQATAGASLEIEPLGITIGGSVEINSADLNVRTITYDDGRQVSEMSGRINDTTVFDQRVYDANGQEDIGQRQTLVLMDDVDPSSTTMLNEAMTGQHVEFSGDQDIQLSFTQEEFETIQQRAQDYVDHFGTNHVNGPFYERILAAETPLDLALTLASPVASGHGSIAEEFLTISNNTPPWVPNEPYGEPLPGSIQIAPDR